MTNVACHPRVAQLRGYPKPVKASLPQEYVQVTPKTYRSSTKRAASADRNQLAAWVGVKGVCKPLKASQAQSNYRIPFRNIQNNSMDPIEFEPLFKVVSTGEGGRALPEPPARASTPPRASKRPRMLPPAPPNPVYTGDAMRSALPPMFPSGFIDDISGYSTVPMRDSLPQTENDHPGITDMKALPPRPASRMGLYRSSSNYNAMDEYTLQGDQDVGYSGRDLEEEIEERDISEVNPFDFDMEAEEMTRELIKMLDF